jgi:hypothetical protein
MDRPNTNESAGPVDPVIEMYKRDIDRTLIRENLKLTHYERLLKLQALMRGIEEMNRVGRMARAS